LGRPDDRIAKEKYSDHGPVANLQYLLIATSAATCFGHAASIWLPEVIAPLFFFFFWTEVY
jgi:hypothetical protein